MSILIIEERELKKQNVNVINSKLRDLPFDTKTLSRIDEIIVINSLCYKVLKSREAVIDLPAASQKRLSSAIIDYVYYHLRNYINMNDIELKHVMLRLSRNLPIKMLIEFARDIEKKAFLRS